MKLSSLSVIAILALAPSCARPPAEPTLVTMIDAPPTTLNPRVAIDAYSQRLNSLILRGLTRLDANLDPQPDLAESWKAEDGGRRVRFVIREDQRDQGGEPINANRLATCLESYRRGEPASAYRSVFPNWESTEAQGRELVLGMRKPDPYFLRNLILLRYFRVEGRPEPCADPGADGRIIASGPYRPDTKELAPETELTLIPVAPESKAPRIRFEFVRDDNTKLLKLLRGEADFVQNALSPAKTRWVMEHEADRFRILERGGINVSYLAFNLKDPVLSKPEIRRAIALAIPRDAIVSGRLGRFGETAGSLLGPSLAESFQSDFPYDPAQAERILDRAGFPRRGHDGLRLELQFKSTPVPESIETALVLRAELQKVGILLNLDVVEPAVFYATIRKRVFQLYASRWIGVADGSLLYDTLHTGVPNNRVSYSNPEVDHKLEDADSELDLTRRVTLMAEVQRQMAADLPYLPLWYWNNALILRKDLTGIDASDLSRSGGFEPLAAIRFQK